AGDIYKHGLESGLPGGDTDSKPTVQLHCDEFNELIGDEFIPLMNKGRGAGLHVTAYTQSLSDIEARLGNAAKSRQVIDNFNNVIMQRVRSEATAELLTRQLPEVMVQQRMLVSTAADDSNVDTDTDFTSSSGDRTTAIPTPTIKASDIVSLPKGQAFALFDGARLHKIRMPLPKAEDSAEIPATMADMAAQMRRRYQSGEAWWRDLAPPPIVVDASTQATPVPQADLPAAQQSSRQAPDPNIWF